MANSNRSKQRIKSHSDHQTLGTRGLLYFLGYKNCTDSVHPRKSYKEPKSIHIYMYIYVCLMSTVAVRD